MSQLFTSGGQSIGVSASASVLPMNEHPGLIIFRMDWLDLLAVQGTLKSSPTLQFASINFSALSFPYGPFLISIHDYMPRLLLTANLLPRASVSAFVK